MSFGALKEVPCRSPGTVIFMIEIITECISFIFDAISSSDIFFGILGCCIIICLIHVIRSLINA